MSLVLLPHLFVSCPRKVLSLHLVLVLLQLDWPMALILQHAQLYPVQLVLGSWPQPSRFTQMRFFSLVVLQAKHLGLSQVCSDDHAIFQLYWPELPFRYAYDFSEFTFIPKCSTLNAWEISLLMSGSHNSLMITNSAKVCLSPAWTFTLKHRLEWFSMTYIRIQFLLTHP